MSINFAKLTKNVTKRPEYTGKCRKCQKYTGISGICQKWRKYTGIFENQRSPLKQLFRFWPLFEWFMDHFWSLMCVFWLVFLVSIFETFGYFRNCRTFDFQLSVKNVSKYSNFYFHERQYIFPKMYQNLKLLPECMALVHRDDCIIKKLHLFGTLDAIAIVLGYPYDRVLVNE